MLSGGCKRNKMEIYKETVFKKYTSEGVERKWSTNLNQRIIII